MLTCNGPHRQSLARCLAEYGIELIDVPVGAAIPGSYWGEPEAGIVGTRLYARSDTPVHSVLHEACHLICMDASRRGGVDTDAGGDFDEENAVCYLQLMLAEQLPNIGRESLASDMDRWGYTFRLGSALSWYCHDADDARAWLVRHGLLTGDGRLVCRLRE